MAIKEITGAVLAGIQSLPVPPLVLSFILSALPVFELRAGIPIGVAKGASIYSATLISILGNILVVPLVFLFLETLHKKFLHIDIYARTFDRYVHNLREKTHGIMKKYGFWGLAIFVGVPLPGTGAYTGAIAAWILGEPFWESFASISIGVVIAGLIVAAVLAGGITTFKFFLGA